MDTDKMLKWNTHDTHLMNSFRVLRRTVEYSDVTLAANGKFYDAHQVILASCSEYFESMLKYTSNKKPMIVLDLPPVCVENLLDYMYLGQVQISAADVDMFLKVAQTLKVKGLYIEVEEHQQFRNRLHLGMAHIEYLAAKFAPRASATTTSNRRQESVSPIGSPPAKRKRCATSEGNSHDTTSSCHRGVRYDHDAVPLTTHSDNFSTAQPEVDSKFCTISSSNIASSMASALSNGLVLNNISENCASDVNNGQMHIPNAMPLVKVEMEDEIEDGSGRVEAKQDSPHDCGDLVDQKLKEEHMKDPLVDDGEDSGLTASADTGVPCEDSSCVSLGTTGTSVQEYLQKELLHSACSDGNADDTGALSSDDADMPALVVNEDPALQDAQSLEVQCNTCGNMLANANLLRRHIEDKHKNVRKHKCPHCIKAFKRKEHLERHLRIHRGEKPFQCMQCKLKFTQKEHLKGHMENVHNKNGKKPPRKSLKNSKNGNRNDSREESPNLFANVRGGELKHVFANGCVGDHNISPGPSGNMFSTPRQGNESGLLDSFGSEQRGLLGRMVGSARLSAESIGGTMTSNLSSALNSMLVASGASNNQPQLGVNCDENQQQRLASLVSSASTVNSPPDLTSPPALAPPPGLPLNTCHQFQPISRSYPGSILSTHSLANIFTLPSNSTHSGVIATNFIPYRTVAAAAAAAVAERNSAIVTTLANAVAASPLNSVLTTSLNLPNTSFSSQPIVSGSSLVLRDNSSPSRGRGTGRGRGRGRGRGARHTVVVAKRLHMSLERACQPDSDKNISGAGVALVANPDSDQFTNATDTDGTANSVTIEVTADRSPSSLCASGNSVEVTLHGSPSNGSSSGSSLQQHVTAVYAPLTRKSVSSPEKHIKKMVLNIP